MEEKEKVVSTEGRMSYEALEEIARRATKENMQLRQAVQELSDSRGIQRLEFLFKVIDNPIAFEDDTVSKAVKEVKEALFPSVETEVKEDKKDNE